MTTSLHIQVRGWVRRWVSRVGRTMHLVPEKLITEMIPGVRLCGLVFFCGISSVCRKRGGGSFTPTSKAATVRSVRFVCFFFLLRPRAARPTPEQPPSHPPPTPCFCHRALLLLPPAALTDDQTHNPSNLPATYSFLLRTHASATSSFLLPAHVCQTNVRSGASGTL